METRHSTITRVCCLLAALMAGSAPLAHAQAPQLDPKRGSDIGLVVEAFLSPHQEPDEESKTPSITPKQFRSSTPSKTRAAREVAGHRGHGIVRFTNDLSRAFVDVKIEGVDPATVNMFHIHCGKPGVLGPILVDFAVVTDVKKALSGSTFAVEIRNEHIVKTKDHGHGPLGALTMGCVVPSPTLGGLVPPKVSTIAGMADIARQGELYFNLHTTGQTYFGDLRGQLYPRP